jgi:hypothetical protein
MVSYSLTFSERLLIHFADAASLAEDGSGNLAAEEPIAPIRAQALTSTTMSTIGGVDKFAAQQYSISGGAQQYTKGPR